MSGLFYEFSRRNVFRVAIAYIAVAWLIVQVADVVLDNIGAPGWVMQTIMFVLAIGFPVAILFAWAFELTPEGLKRETEVDRSQSVTRATGQKLNRMIIGVLLAAVAFLLVDKFMLGQPATDEVVTDKSVAVLPFVAMSRGPDDEYFADGLTEEILNSLTRVPELLVTARTSAFHFKGKDIPIPEVAAQLGVAHVVEGSVRRAGDRLRVTAQLIRAADGFHLWSDTYDRETENTFAVQTDIAEKIASALGIYLDDDTLDHMRTSGFRNPEAYVAFQKARELYDRAHDDNDVVPVLRETNEWLERVIALEPGTSEAYLMHSDLYLHMLRNDFDSLSDAERRAAVEALQSDLDAAVQAAETEALRLAASYDRALLTGEWQSLTDIFDAYVDTVSCPGYMWGNTNTLEFGRADEVHRLSRLIIACDPQGPFGWWNATQSLIWLGDFEGAIEVGEEGMATAAHSNTLGSLLYAYVGAGRYDEALQLANQHATGDIQLSEARLVVAAGQGNEALVRELLEDLRRNRPDEQLRFLSIAGARDEANRTAAEIDALPYGFLTLMGITSGCRCGAPWDLEVTPNYANKLKDAGLSWPPASPIEWPLKGW